ncbi:cation:proton antiporter [Kibdelosporangium persicum]|uniref:Transport system membrane component n=1 Tax=Kibdelosporangium persicum TaxID=2698649 RepID=A0ABX2FIT2_9PSEU|nr:Transport system membrane component [Kibdelosporangium persicum]
MAAAGAIVVVLAASWIGRRLAALVRQPAVMGEIAVGLLLGPGLLQACGPQVRELLLPRSTLEALHVIGVAGLALYLVGVAHRLGPGLVAYGRKSLLALTICAVSVPMAIGGGVGFWLLVTDDARLRGDAPAAALVLMFAVSFTVSAVPVLARIIDDRGIAGTRAARLAMASAIIVDAIGWLLLAVAVGLAGAGLSGSVRAAVILVVAVAMVPLVRRLLSRPGVTRLCGRSPTTCRMAVAVVAIVASWAADNLGLTAVFGAVLIAVSLPPDEDWQRVAGAVSSAGRWLLPIFFATAGITVWSAADTTFPVMFAVVVTVLAVLGKTAGVLLGARLGGETGPVRQRLAVLLNTRGLTEIVLVQAGYSAGIITAPVYLVFVVLALVSTAMTGPLLSLLDKRRPLVPQDLATAGGAR